MEMVKGVVESKARNGSSIKVDGEWYGTYKGKGLESVNWKDTVEFLYEMDKSGKYRNIKGAVKVLGGGAPSSGGGVSAPSNGGGYNNLGVELGHASKLAMDLAICIHGGNEIGGREFYKTWLEHTEKVYECMKKLREKVGKPPAPVAPVPTASDDDEIDPFA